MPAQHGETLAGITDPHASGAIIAAGDDDRRIGRERRRVDCAVVTDQDDIRVAVLDAPEPCRLVADLGGSATALGVNRFVRPRHDVAVVWAEDVSTDGIAKYGQATGDLPAREIANERLMIPDDLKRFIRGDDDRDCGRISRGRLARLGIEHPLILADDASAIAREPRRADVRDRADRITRRRRPELHGAVAPVRRTRRTQNPDAVRPEARFPDGARRAQPGPPMRTEQRLAERRRGLRRPVDLHTVDGQLQTLVRIDIQLRNGPRRHLTRAGRVALNRRHKRHDAGREGEKGEADAGRPGQPLVSADDPHVLADQLVLGPAVDGGGQVGDLIAELRVLQREVVFRLDGAHVHVERLFGKGAAELTRQGIGSRPVEISRFRVPEDLALGQDDEQVLDRLAALRRRRLGEPVLDLALNPDGLSGLGRRHEDEMARLVQGADDGGPELRRRRQAGLVAEDVERPQAQQRLGETMQGRLDAWSEPPVRRMTVGDERVVGHGRESRRD